MTETLDESPKVVLPKKNYPSPKKNYLSPDIIRKIVKINLKEEDLEEIKVIESNFSLSFNPFEIVSFKVKLKNMF